MAQRSRLRASLHRADAAGIDARRLKTIQRRSYDAAAPNYVWHIDGTHKLIKGSLSLTLPLMNLVGL